MFYGDAVRWYILNRNISFILNIDLVAEQPQYIQNFDNLASLVVWADKVNS